MTAEARYSALAAADRAALLALADEILAADTGTAVVLEPATAGVGALRLPAPAGGSFVVGHVVLTTGAVRLAGQRGDGVRPGRDPEGALAAAVCDAEAERAGPRAAQVADLVARTDASTRSQMEATARLVAQTRIGVGS